MPLDSHSYLVAQGWAGKGFALRHGAISRPLAVPRKKNLSGLGNDRDEAYPFWDHLYSSAANTIQLRVQSDSDEDNECDTGLSNPTSLRLTATGILSNRRPTTGVIASSSVTHRDDSSRSRHSLLSVAKREAAKSILYSRFYRGPTLGPDDEHQPGSRPDIVGFEVAVEEGKIKEKRKEWDKKDSKEQKKRRKRLLKEEKPSSKSVEKLTKKKRKYSDVAVNGVSTSVEDVGGSPQNPEIKLGTVSDKEGDCDCRKASGKKVSQKGRLK